MKPEMAFAQEDREAGMKVRIGSNECWTGPMPVGLAALVKTAPTGNRYSPNNERGKLIKAISQIENVLEDHILPRRGSKRSAGPFGFRLLLAHQIPGPGRSQL